MAPQEQPLDHYTKIKKSADQLIARGWHLLQGPDLVQVSGTYTADEIVEKINALAGFIVDKKKVHSRMNRALNIVSEEAGVPRSEVQDALDRTRIETGCQERMNGVKGSSKRKPTAREKSVASATASEAAPSTVVDEADSVRDTATRKTTRARVDTPLLGSSVGTRKRRESIGTTTSRSTTTKTRRGGRGERVAAEVKHAAKVKDEAPPPDNSIPRRTARDTGYAVSFRSTANDLDEAAAADAALRRRVGEGLGLRPERIELEVGLTADEAAILLLQLYREDSKLAQ